jgi:hypothetical protein
LLGFRAIAPAPLLDPLAIALALLVGLLTCQRAVPIRLVSLTSSLYLGRLVIEEALALGVLALLLPQCLVVESAGGVCAHGEQGSHVLPLPASPGEGWGEVESARNHWLAGLPPAGG